MRVLAVSDEVEESLYVDVRAVRDVQLILACGDLPFDYLAYLMDAVRVPLVFVPGNHDPDVSGYRMSRGGLMLRAGMPVQAPWPDGATNVDGRIVDILGLRIAGLGGCLRYHDGPNQYSEREQRRRARGLARRARWATRDGHQVDVVLTHAPPRGVGDGDDPPHRGFECLHALLDSMHAPLLLHGHVHPYGEGTSDLQADGAIVRNVVGRHVFDVAVPGANAKSR